MFEDAETVAHEAFRDGLARLCAKALWRQLNVLRMKRNTVRFLRNREIKQSFVTQVQISGNIFRDQGTIAKYFREGSAEWSNMAMVMTDLNVELFDFRERLPDRDKRALAGRRRALQRIQERIIGSKVKEPSEEDVCYLMAINGSLAWKKAKLQVDSEKRQKELKELAAEIAREAEQIFCNRIVPRGHEELLTQEDEWGKAWDICSLHICIKWSVA